MSLFRPIGTRIAGQWLALLATIVQPTICLCATQTPWSSGYLVAATRGFGHGVQLTIETDAGLPPSHSTSQVESGRSASFVNTTSDPSPPDRTTKAILDWEPAARAPDSDRPKGTINASLADENFGRWNIGGNGDATYISNRRGYHPGTRVIIELLPPSLKRGEAPKSANARHYLAEFRSRGYWPYRACFEATARDNPSKGGDTWILVQFSSHGRSTTSRLLKSNVKQPQIADCLVRATHSISLQRPPRAGANVTLLVRIFPGDAPLVPSNSLESKTITVDQGAFTAAIRPIQTAIEACVRAGLDHDPKLWGRLALLLYLDNLGRVVQAMEHESRFPNSSVVKCSVDAARAHSLPNITKGGWHLIALRVGAIPTIVTESTDEHQEPAQEPRSLSVQEPSK